MHLCTYFTVYSITISNGQHNLSFRQKGTIASQVMRYHADWLCVRSPNKQQEAHPCTRTSPKSLPPLASPGDGLVVAHSVGLRPEMTMASLGPPLVPLLRLKRAENASIRALPSKRRFGSFASSLSSSRAARRILERTREMRQISRLLRRPNSPASLSSASSRADSKGRRGTL